MIKLGELFCGPGGFAEGAKKAGGFKHVWANDIHPDSCKTFKKHHPDCEVFEGDVFKDFINNEMKKLSKNIFKFLVLSVLQRESSPWDFQ